MRALLAAPFVLLALNLTLPAADVAEVPGKPILAVDRGGHVAPVVDFNLTPDGKKLFTLSEDNTLQIWDAATREHLKTLRLNWQAGEKGTLLGFVHAHSILQPSPNGKSVVVTLCNAPSGATTGRNRFNYEPFLVHVETGRIKRLPGFNKGEDIHLLTFSSDGEMLAAELGVVGSRDKKLNNERFNTRICVWRGLNEGGPGDAPAPALWKMWKLPQVDTYQAGSSGIVHDLQFSPNGSQLAASLSFHDFKKPRPAVPILCWNLNEPSAKPREIAAGGAAVRLAWSPQGTRLAAEAFVRQSKDLSSMAIDRVHDVAKIVAWNSEGLMLQTTKNSWPTIARPIFHGENQVQWLGATGPNNQERPAAMLRVELQKGRAEEVRRCTLPQEWNRWKAFPDLQRFAVWRNGMPNVVSILEFEPEVKVQPLYATRPTPAIAFSKKGLKLAWTNYDKTKLIAGLNLRTAEPLQPAELNAEDFTASGTEATAGNFKAVSPFARGGGLIDIQEKGKLVFRVFAADQEWVLCTPEGYYTASPGGEKIVGWHVNSAPDKLASFYPLDRFRKQLHRPDVLARVLERGSVAAALKVANAFLPKEDAAAKGGIADLEKLLPPVVELSVLDQSKLPAVKLQVSAKAGTREQPIKALRLLVDGRPFTAASAAIAFDQGVLEDRREWTVELPPGKHHVAVLVRSADASSVSNEVTLDCRDPAEKPVMHVLTVGISSYADKSLNLQCADKDAHLLAETFQKTCRGVLFTEVRTKVLLNDQATRPAILQAIQTLRTDAKAKVKANDLVIVFFAGHGAKQEDRFYLLPHETKLGDLANTALSGKELRDALAAFPCQVFLMLDACHSGAFGEKGKLTAQNLRPATDDATRTFTDDEVGVAVMCAAMGNEKAEERGNNGLFTKAIVEALTAKNGVPFNQVNRRQYVHHLQAHVFDRVLADSQEKQHPFLHLPCIVESFPLRQLPPMNKP